MFREEKVPQEIAPMKRIREEMGEERQRSEPVGTRTHPPAESKAASECHSKQLRGPGLDEADWMWDGHGVPGHQGCKGSGTTNVSQEFGGGSISDFINKE